MERFYEEINDIDDLAKRIESKVDFSKLREKTKNDHLQIVLQQVKKTLINFDLKHPSIQEMEDFWNDK